MTEHVEESVLRHFSIGQLLGRGAYGIVWQAVEKRTQNVMALKKCYEAFRNSTDAQRTYREVMYLQKLDGHENIVRLHNVMNATDGKDLYLTFDFMPADLHVVIRSNILEDIHKEYIIYQLLRALKYIHSAGLIHRDIKPSNLLIDTDCNIKLCDFGLCRSITNIQDRRLTDYVATRWYRCPEVLLGSTKYTTAIDMWSVACILGEMLSHRPLLPGYSTMNQIEKILEVTGYPNEDELQSMQSPFAETMIESIRIFEKTKIPVLCPKASTEALDFMKHCMRLNPQKRLTADLALLHPYVSGFHDLSKEPKYCDGPIEVSIFI